MKKIVLYAAIAVAAVLAPVKAMDVADLRPVRVVMVSREEGNILLQTDTGDWGMGENVTSALENLKSTTPGVLYLDTAQYLLVTKDAQDTIEQFREVMKGKVRLSLVKGVELTQETAAFLRVHGQLPQLEVWEKGCPLPLLTTSEKRLIFSKKK